MASRSSPTKREDRGRQVVRQWKLLRALERNREGLGLEDAIDLLADEAPTTRTLRRDFDQLAQVGFPVEKHGARWRLDPNAAQAGWYVPLDPSQIVALHVAERLLDPLRNTAFARPLLDLRRSLRAVCDRNTREFADLLAGTFTATLSRPGALADSEVVETIDDAMGRDHRLRIAYQKPNDAEATWRLIDPYAAWYHDGRLYLVGWCHEAAAWRTFNFQRIQAAEMVDEAFDRVPDFELEKYVKKGFGVLHGQPETIVLELAPEVAHIAEERVLHPSQSTERLASGVTRVSFVAEGLREVAAWVSSFGGQIRAVAPPELVDEVRRRAAGTLEAHADAGDRTAAPSDLPRRARARAT